MRTLGRLRWSTWCGRLLDARPARERRTHPKGRLTALRRRGPLARLLGSRGSSWLAFGAKRLDNPSPRINPRTSDADAFSPATLRRYLRPAPRQREGPPTNPT